MLFVYLFVFSLQALQGVQDEPQKIRALLLTTSVFRHFPCAAQTLYSMQVITLYPFNLFIVSVQEVSLTDEDKTHAALFGG